MHGKVHGSMFGTNSAHGSVPNIAHDRTSIAHDRTRESVDESQCSSYQPGGLIFVLLCFRYRVFKLVLSVEVLILLFLFSG